MTSVVSIFHTLIHMTLMLILAPKPCGPCLKRPTAQACRRHPTMVGHSNEDFNIHSKWKMMTIGPLFLKSIGGLPRSGIL
jgi:hypothetical protein